MSASHQETRFRIETATEDDWPWIVQGEVEIACVRLSPERRKELSRQRIGERVAQRVARIRKENGFPNVAFVARTSEGERAGFVWVARTHNDFTGQLEASLMSQYVEKPYRGKGLGHQLLETAEAWAQQQGLPRISLCVGANNTMGQRLYESLGYQVETLRMSKKLGPEESEEIHLDDD